MLPSKSDTINDAIMFCEKLGYPRDSDSMIIILNKALTPYARSIDSCLRKLERWGDLKAKYPTVNNLGHEIDVLVNRQDLKQIGEMINTLKGFKL